MYTCSYCTKKACRHGEKENMPANCPCLDEQLAEESKAAYQGEALKIALAACKTEYEGYCKRTRVEEIMEFANSMGYRKLGIAHCIGLSSEARTAAKIFSANGFEVETVCCKAGAIPKEALGASAYQLREGYESACNPVGQAMLLEKAGCELAVIVGLCVGHDTLFIRASRLPITYLVVKDRAIGHNPAAALYGADSYFHDRLFPPTRKTGKL